MNKPLQALFVLLTAASLTACYDPPAVVNCTSDSGESDCPSPDVGNNSTSPNNDAGDTTLAECTAAPDCAPKPGATATCEFFTCSYSCLEGFFDLNHNIPVDGCECEVTSETDLCDGIDNDCDGDTDEDQAELACGLTQGVCEDSTFTCPGANPAEACGAAQYGLDWNESDDERWRCDSLDNDCDGDSDEACCAAPGDLAPTSYGATSSQFPAITPALDNTGAAFLLAWAEGTDVKLAHVDALGTEVGTGEILGNVEITSVAVATAPNGYEVAFTTEDNGAYILRATTVASDLTATSLETLAGGGDELANVDIATTDTHSCLVWSQAQMLDNSVQLTCFGHGDAANAPASVEISTGAARTVEPTRPKLVAHSKGVTGVWWKGGAADTGLHARTAIPNDLALQPLQSQSSTLPNIGDTFAISATNLRGEVFIVAPDFDGRNQILSASTFYVAANSFSEKSTVVTDGTPDSPAILATDADDDGIVELVILAYTANGDLLVGAISASMPGLVSNLVTLQSGSLPGTPALSLRDYQVGALWRQGSTRFAPLSRGAAPICGL